MVLSGDFKDQSILLIDQEDKSRNDRTWCFWEKSDGFFENIIHHSWSRAWFHDHGFSKLLDLSPYRYKMIRGIDFYSYCKEILSRQDNVSFLKSRIDGMGRSGEGPYLSAGGLKITSRFIFNSLIPEKHVVIPPFHDLLQHFKGWIIETPEPAFDAGVATLMDFRPSQKHGATFVYVMPLTDRRALVEYTLFSKSLLQDEEYEDGLRHYISDTLGIGSYAILEKESGVIPMTDQPFKKAEAGIVNIGTAGGNTKASTGYTFQFIQKQTAAIVHSLAKSGDPLKIPERSAKRFKWFDSVLLNVLAHHRMEGHDVFRILFKKNDPSSILRFLDNDSSVSTEVRLLNTLPIWPFLKAGVQEIHKYL